MPFAGYKDFADCVAQNKDKKNPQSYCAFVMRQVEKAEWTTAYVNDLPDSAFAYVEPGGSKDTGGKTVPRSLRHLPYKDKDGNIDRAHVANALSRLPQTHGIPPGRRDSIRSMLQSRLGGEVKKSAKGLTGMANDNQTKLQDEEITNLNPGEVSLTLRPAVRENVLMAKSEVMNEEQLRELAKSLGLEDMAQLTDEQVKKAEEDIRKGFMDAGGAPPAAPPAAPPSPAENPFQKKPQQPPAFLDKSVSQYVTMAAKMLAPVMSSLPEEVQKFFSGGATAQEPMPMMKSEQQVEVFKSMFPDVEQAIRGPLEKQVDELQKSIKTLEDSAQLSEMLTVAKDISPEPEKAAALLVNLRKSLPADQFEAYVESQRNLYRVAQSSEAFKTISKSSPSSVTAEEQVIAKAEEIVARAAPDANIPLVRAQAITTVLQSNPELAQQYDREMTRKAAARSGEED